MRRKKNFRKKRPKDNAVGLSVTVFNNNVDEALRRLKKKVKNSNMLQELRKKECFIKPSIIKREKRNLSKLRAKYAIEKEKAKNNH